MTNRIVAAIVVLLAVGAAYVVGRQTGTTASDMTSEPDATVPEVKQPIAVEVLVVNKNQAYETLREFVGRVESARQSDLAFERGGRAAEVLVNEGDVVPVNAVVARLDTALLRAERNVRKARRDSEKARLDELVAGPRVEAISAAGAEVDQLKSDLQLSRITEARQERLFRTGSSPEQRYDEARLASRSLEARLAAAQARLEELTNGTRTEQVAAQQAAVAQADADLAAIDVDLQKSELRAPYAGQVAIRHVDDGEVLAAGTPVVTLIESAEMEVRVGLPGGLANGIASNDLTTIEVNDVERNARVIRVSPQRSGDMRTIDVIFALEPSRSDNGHASGVRDGDTAIFRYERQVQADGYWLPIGALVEGVRGLWSCYVLRDGDGGQVVERLPLEVVFNDQTKVFVAGPLAEGDSVVVSGVHRLVPGQRVDVVKRRGEITGIGVVPEPETSDLALGPNE